MSWWPCQLPLRAMRRANLAWSCVLIQRPPPHLVPPHTDWMVLPSMSADEVEYHAESDMVVAPRLSMTSDMRRSGRWRYQRCRRVSERRLMQTSLYAEIGPVSWRSRGFLASRPNT